MIKIKNLMKNLTITNIKSYIVGMFRYKLYYSKYKKFIRKHILEQIDFRIDYMKIDCYNNGSCVKCGCLTTALQMANKSCEGECYPEMMDKKSWVSFRNGVPYKDIKNNDWILNEKDGMLIHRSEFFNYDIKFKTDKTKSYEHLEKNK